MAAKKPKKKPGVPVNAKSGVGANTQATPPPDLEIPEELEALWDPKVAKAFASLKPKHQAFILVYVRTGNAAESYRRSYNPLASPHLATVCGNEILSNPAMTDILAKLTEQNTADFLLVQKTYREMTEAVKPEWVQDKDGQWENVGDIPDWKARKDAADGLAKLRGMNAPAEVKHSGELTSRVVQVELPKKKSLPAPKS